MGRKSLSPRERDFVRERAGGCCEYCKFPVDFSHDAFHIEHIFPLSLGGQWTLDNLAFACDRCNSKKWAHTHGIDPATGTSTPLFHPRFDSWEEHFGWSEDFTQIIGQTPTGRATVELLELNRTGLVNVRRALRAFGVHPANS